MKLVASFILLTVLMGCGGSSSSGSKVAKKKSPITQPEQDGAPEEAPARTPHIINNTRATVKYDKDTNTFLVDRPQIERLIIKATGILAHITFCEGWNGSKKYFELIAKTQIQVDTYQEKIEKAEKDKAEKVAELEKTRGQLSKDQITRLEWNISNLQRLVDSLINSRTHYEERIADYKEDIAEFENIKMRLGGTAKVRLESEFEENLKILKADNPHLEISSAPLTSPRAVKIKAIGLEELPAEKMIHGLEEKLGIKQIDGKTIMNQYPENLPQAHITLYAACPLLKPEVLEVGDVKFDQIIIEFNYL